MNIITKRITLDILLYTAVAVVVILGVYAFFEMVIQFKRFSDHSVSQALLVTAVLIPLRLYQFLPLCVLMGSIATMSFLSRNSEFTALRVGGMSPMRLLKIVMLPATILLIFTYFLGEVVTPPLLRYELEIKTQAKNEDALMPRGFRTGVWLRDLTQDEKGQKLDRFVNVAYVRANNRRETGPWRVFEYNGQGELVSLTRAQEGYFDPEKGWVLKNVTETNYPPVALIPTKEDQQNQGVTQTHIDTQVFASNLGADIFGTLTTRTDEMSMRELFDYIQHLQKNNQKSDQQQLMFYQKLFYPLGILVMLLMGLPFAYMSNRAGGAFLKIFIGIIVGIGFYTLNSIFAFLGLVDGLSPALLTVLPSLLMIGLGVGALFWVERR